MLSSTNEWILREQLKNKPDIRSDGNPDLTVCYQSILQKYPFNLEMKIRPDGVRFYIVEQFFDIIKFYSMVHFFC